MLKWIELPSKPLRYQPIQMEFLEARRLRICPICKQDFKVNEHPLCPNCAVKGIRKWDRLLIIAGRRFGKTKIGSIAAAEEATIPNSVIWCCAPTDPKLERYVIPAMQELIPEKWVKSWNAEYKDLRLKNNSLIHFQTLQDPDQGRGQGLDALWIDEICELTKKHWEVIRPSLAGDTVAFFTTSPRGYDWVYNELNVPAERGDAGHWAAHAKTSESANPKITEEFLAREKSQMSEIMYRQEYEADFVIFTGSVYGDLINSQILKTDEQVREVIPEWRNIDDWRQVVVGIDTGADHPFGAVKLISCEKGLVVVGEYLERDKTFIQHCSSLKRLAASPTAKWAINKNERQPMLELAQHGIYCQKSENDIVAGTERVKSWLHAQQLWFVESRCPQTLNQLRAYRWAENKSPKDDQKRKEKVFKLADELPDCLRYALMTWPTLPKAPPEESVKLRDLSHFDAETRATILRMRKIDKVDKDNEPNSPKSIESEIALDFWM